MSNRSKLVEIKKVGDIPIYVDPETGKFYATVDESTFTERSIKKIEAWIAARQGAVKVLYVTSGYALAEGEIIGYTPPKNPYESPRWLGRDGRDAYRYGRVLPYDAELLARSQALQREVDRLKGEIEKIQSQQYALYGDLPTFTPEDFDALKAEKGERA